MLDFSASYLSAVFGIPRLKRMLMLAETLAADEALDCGFLLQVCEAGEIDVALANTSKPSPARSKGAALQSCSYAACPNTAETAGLLIKMRCLLAPPCQAVGG